MVEWKDLQYGDLVLIDLRLDKSAVLHGWPRRAWGKIVNTHVPGQYGLAMEGLPIPAQLSLPTAGFMFFLGPDHMDRVLDHAKPV